LAKKEGYKAGLAHAIVLSRLRSVQAQGGGVCQNKYLESDFAKKQLLLTSAHKVTKK
jgi:hypothetical protein